MRTVILVRIAFLFAVGLLASGCGAAPAVPLNRSCLVPTFADDFARLDRSRWISHWYYGDPNGVSSRRSVVPDAHENDLFVDDAFRLRPGGIDILVRPNPDRADPRSDNADFLAGALTTEQSFSQRYGYFEARFSAPPEPGLWPAFWLYDAPVRDRRPLPPFGTPGALQTRLWRGLYSGGLNGEIDVVEIMTNKPRTSFHTASPRYRWANQEGGERIKLNNNNEPTAVENTAPATAPHVYGVLWTPTRIAFYRDDILVAETANRGLHAPMYMLVSMGTGGWGGNLPPRDMKQPAVMAVDFVRAFQLRPGGGVGPDGALTCPSGAQ